MVRLRENESINQVRQGNLTQERQYSRIVSCQVNGEKLITQLNDGREVSLSISLLTKLDILEENVRPEQLKKYELQDEGRYIYFPEIDDILPARIISEGLFKSCWER